MPTLLKYVKTIVLTLIAGISFQQVNAQVIDYTNVPDTTIDFWEVYSIWGGCDIWFHPDPEVVLRTKGLQVMVDDDGLPIMLGDGGTIDASANWDSVNYACLNCKGATGNWLGVDDGYLAIRKRTGNDWKYGWVKMDVEANGRSFTVKEYAMHTQPNEAIKAGQVFATALPDVKQSDEVNIATVNKGIVVCNTQGMGSVAITDMTGKLVMLVKLEQNLQYIDMSNYPAGVYAVVVRSTKGTRKFKVGL